MNFLEARTVLSGFAGGSDLSFVLASSGTMDQIIFYLRAHAALGGFDAKVEALPFGTLQQFLRDPTPSPSPVVTLLFPWDFVPECDWRSGVPVRSRELPELLLEAEAIAALVRKRSRHLFYVPARLPPIWADPRKISALELHLKAIAESLGADVLSADSFVLSSYLASGTPVGAGALSPLAAQTIAALTKPATPVRKVLISDLDNVMWSGVIAEDGLDGIAYRAQGLGWKHFLYQTFLKKLKDEGALLAAVSRNDARDASLPFEKGDMTLQSDDFVTILASYNAKSAQIREIATHLNLGLESFVFVDDNPIEIAEVRAALPDVECLTFPVRDEALPDLFDRMQMLFARRHLSEEDRQRTALYRRRLEGIAPNAATGGDLKAFLESLEMRLRIHRRGADDCQRAIQLINKTNQFNLNGRRWTEQQLESLLMTGGSLTTASLDDKNGSHGEIIACLIDGNGTIQSLVMSCRVFQRRVEHAFLAWLARQPATPRRLDYVPTDRNEPLRQFLAEVMPEAATDEAQTLDFDSPVFLHRFESGLPVQVEA